MTFRFMNFTIVLVIILSSYDSYGITGDLDRDGDVDFDDFFVFADNFGKTGAPEELVYQDTVIIQDTLRVTSIDTVVFDIFDTLNVTVYDTLKLETVYDTVSIEFVGPPEYPIDEKAGWIDGLEESAYIEFYFSASYFGYDSGKMDWHRREPVDSDDDTEISWFPYSNLNIRRSVLIRFVPLSVDDNLDWVVGDTLIWSRQTFIAKDAWDGLSFHSSLGIEDTTRFPDRVNTTGNMIIDVVERTQSQGDFATRMICSVRYTDNGKILLSQESSTSTPYKIQ